MTEKELRANVVAIAVGFIGCKESDGSHKKIIDIYNSHKPLARGYAVKYTDAWCSTFASAVAIKAGLTDIIPTECGCEKHIALFKALGRWQEHDAYVPSPGDYIFYDWQDGTNYATTDNTGAADHVGIVEKVSGQTITVIEGNYSNAVKRRTLAVNGRYIRGYGIPKYGSKATTAEENKEEDDMKNYKLLTDVPSAYKDAVQKVVDKGALKGTGNGELNVSEDLCRVLTILDRLGKLD